jgi:protein-tyrosine phosphatase
VLDILAYCAAGEYVYLHCSDGNGRSGTVAAAIRLRAFNDKLELFVTDRL